MSRGWPFAARTASSISFNNLFLRCKIRMAVAPAIWGHENASKSSELCSGLFGGSSKSTNVGKGLGGITDAGSSESLPVSPL